MLDCKTPYLSPILPLILRWPAHRERTCIGDQLYRTLRAALFRHKSLERRMGMSTTSAMKRTLLAGAVGNVLEWYDFALYGYFAPVFAALFFPSNSPSVSLISAFGVFAVGFLARPLGAMLFGYWGDTLGRRNALAWSILLMAIPTCLVGLLPTYDTIGVIAPIALTLCRFLQGLSVGGEFTGSATFLVEHASASQRGYVGSWAGFSAQIGALLGSGVGALVASNLADETLRQWGWRIPFMMGGLIAVVGWYVRTSVPESPAFETIRLRRRARIFPRPRRVHDAAACRGKSRRPRMAARRGVLPPVRLSDDLSCDGDTRSPRDRTHSQYGLHGASGSADSLDGRLVGSDRTGSPADDRSLRGSRFWRIRPFSGSRAMTCPV